MARLWLEDILPLHLSTVTFPTGHPLAGETGDVLGFAIRHPAGVVLFDTGIGAINPYVEEHYQPQRHSLEQALAGHDIALADVTAIVNCHLHFDHCGNNPLFPGVPIYAQDAELEATREPWYTIADCIDFPGVEYRPIDGDLPLRDGITIVTTPGHTAGHQSLVLETAEGVVVLAGQAVYTRSEFDAWSRDAEPVGAGGEAHPQHYIASARRLLGLKPRRVHFSHDREIWNAPNPQTGSSS